MSRRMPVLAAGTLWFLSACAMPASAQVPDDASLPSQLTANQPVEVTADQLEYEADKKLMTGRGNVVLRYGADIMRCDFVTVRTDTQDAHAMGNVVFEAQDGRVWKGEEVRYNFKTRVGDFGTFSAFVDPYFVKSDDSKRVSANEFVLHNATITTCEGDRPEYRIRAREARVVNNESLTARGVVFFLGPVPIFYVPRWTKHMGGDGIDVDLVPGYSSRMGPYLLTAYNYRFNSSLTAATHLDFRAKRGIGVGQDVNWGDPRLSYNGEFRAYYLNDQSPLESRSPAEIQSLDGLVDSERYRLRLSDVHYFTSRDYLITELNYLSDPAVLEDFFNREFRDNAQPENRISLTHRGDNFTAGLTLNRRLNDFYGNVNRVPEASLSVPRLRIAETPLYYESANTAAWLERVFPENTGIESYDAFRIDTGHKIYYPTRHFGFLNVTPRTGYRATYYSKTFDYSSTTNVISTVTDTNSPAVITNEVVTVTADQGADIRNVFELGLETSFKAFSVWHNDWISRDDQGLRHVVEPYANYTYIPEPDLVPTNLPQFDEVDTIDQRNDVTFGVRNKFQTKRRGQIHNLADVNVYTTYRLDPGLAERDFSDVFFDTELRLVDGVNVDFDGRYDSYEERLNTFNTQLGLVFAEDTRLGVEYRYSRTVHDQLAGELTLFPNRKWSLTIYERFSFTESTLEEQSYFIQHKTDCMGYGLGMKNIDGEIQVWLQIWLIAFPSSSIELGM